MVILNVFYRATYQGTLGTGKDFGESEVWRFDNCSRGPGCQEKDRSAFPSTSCVSSPTTPFLGHPAQPPWLPCCASHFSQVATLLAPSPSLGLCFLSDVFSDDPLNKHWRHSTFCHLPAFSPSHGDVSAPNTPQYTYVLAGSLSPH